MSIIYDALKKIAVSQEQINSSTKNKISHGVNKGGKSKLKSYSIYVLAVCLGLFIASIFFNLFTRHLQVNDFKEVQDVNLSQALPKDSNSTALTAEFKKESHPSLVLNGVFFSQNQGYALINNQIVKEGDMVEGARVLRIGLEEVELELEGLTIKLFARR